MAEYTYADVIIDPEDPRVEIGKEYCFGNIPKNLIEAANSSNDNFWERLEKVTVTDGFCFTKEGGWSASCLIRKKESEKKWIPFDLTKEEDRARLRGAWVRFNNDPAYECQVFAISKERVYIWSNCDYLTPEELLRDCVFLDGSPCGKLVEEVR